MAETPLISVIIPARNAAATLAQTLESLLAQSETDWQALIVDDGSTDGTAALAAGFAGRDPRFAVLAGPGQGVGAARNLGLAASRGRWLHFLDADDWNDPEFYARMLAALDAAPAAMAAFCGYRRVMPDRRLTRPYFMPGAAGDLFEEFARGCLVAIHSVLARREAVAAIGGFDTSLVNGEDWDLWQRLSRFGGDWVRVPEALAYYRTDGPSLSRKVATFMAHSGAIIRRGFGPDERLAGRDPKHAAGADPALGGGLERALAFNAIWSLGMDCGAGGAMAPDPDRLAQYDRAGLEAAVIAGILFEGLLVGAQALPDQLAARWPLYGERLTRLVAGLGEIWRDAGAARAIQYHLEERILYSEESGEKRRFSLTQSERVDIADPPFTVLAPGVDRIYAGFVENGAVTHVTLAALGDFSKAEWLRVRGIATEIDYRRWRAAQGPVASLLRAGEATKILLGRPALLRRREGLRAAREQGWRTARLRRLGRPDPPGSHARAWRRLAAWAADHAAQAGEVDAMPPPNLLHEDRVDPGRRQAHFETLFDREDPWNYGSAYEQQKYAEQLEMLPPAPIGKALELACAEGHFTAMLAGKTGRLLATDISEKALARTRRRCAEHGNIDYLALDFAAGPIPGDMQLIVCSEVLYYLSGEAELRRVAAAIAAALRPGGWLLTAHAFVLKDDLSRTGFDWEIVYGAEVIRRVFGEIAGLELDRTLETELYRIDRFRKTEGEPAAPGAPPMAETRLLAAGLDTEVARAVVWGGAAIRRNQASETEHRPHVPVLMYHGIADAGPAGLARYRVSTARFREQLRWLRANGFYGIGSEELAAQMASGGDFRGRPVMLSFDDGLQDFAENAWAALLAHDFTAEMFIVTDRVGGTADWDARLGPPARLMDAATIARLAAEGMKFGSHLATHRPVDGLSSLELAQELAGSRALLERWLGRPPVGFAAPFTITDNRLGGLAAAAGYRIGFGGGTGVARLDADPLDLPRIEVQGGWSLAEFIACMEAWL